MSLAYLNEDKDDLRRATARGSPTPGGRCGSCMAAAEQYGDDVARPALHRARAPASTTRAASGPRDDRGGARGGRAAGRAGRRRWTIHGLRRRDEEVAPRRHGPGRARRRHAGHLRRRQRASSARWSPRSRAARPPGGSGTASGSSPAAGLLRAQAHPRRQADLRLSSSADAPSRTARQLRRHAASSSRGRDGAVGGRAVAPPEPGSTMRLDAPHPEQAACTRPRTSSMSSTSTRRGAAAGSTGRGEHAPAARAPTAAASSSATSRPTTRTAGGSPTAPGGRCWPSTTGGRPSIRTPRPPTTSTRRSLGTRDAATSLGVDTSRVAIVGDSAGAAALAVAAAAAIPAPSAMRPSRLPVRRPAGAQPSYRRESGGLTADEMDWYWAQYLPGRGPPRPPGARTRLEPDLTRPAADAGDHRRARPARRRGRGARRGDRRGRCADRGTTRYLGNGRTASSATPSSSTPRDQAVRADRRFLDGHARAEVSARPDRITAMRVHIGSDHAGSSSSNIWSTGSQRPRPRAGRPRPVRVRRRRRLSAVLSRARRHAVVADPGSLGIVIGGSGNGEQIAANKVDGVRAALAWSTETAELGSAAQQRQRRLDRRAHAHASTRPPASSRCSCRTTFTGEERHVRRIAMLTDYEQTSDLPPTVPDRPASQAPRCPRATPSIRLAADLREAFLDRPSHASSPQGRFAEEAALVDGHVLESSESAGQAPVPRPSDARRCVVHVHLGLIGVFSSGRPPRPSRSARFGCGSRATRRTPTCAGATMCELITPTKMAHDPGQARSRPAARRRRPGQGVRPHPQEHASRSAPC